MWFYIKYKIYYKYKKIINKKFLSIYKSINNKNMKILLIFVLKKYVSKNNYNKNKLLK